MFAQSVRSSLTLEKKEHWSKLFTPVFNLITMHVKNIIYDSRVTLNRKETGKDHNFKL